MKTGSRMSRQARLLQLRTIAAVHFARDGYAGASIEAIASEAGVSTPYVYKSFAGKAGLFAEAFQSVMSDLTDGMVAAAEGATGTAGLVAMGRHYKKLVQDRSPLVLKLQAFAAADNPELTAAVRDAYRDHWTRLRKAVKDVPIEEFRVFMALGEHLNGMAIIGATNVGPDFENNGDTRVITEADYAYIGGN
ncbi:TetR/AcrR family transcriptional regulator [Tsukamurella ocularis]|uniref:TetR/AcrR family transcriptional regulator n=1 Tax=Tsukamurella ocularis TaxID=1970234 RepID=UPI002166E7B0|nr:TetR/AcrR family transcriptional regulator [Tsukamurella ocularis]MCS3852440.1 AcrR family transcriptional regulator [Tsukamurella ocularis]